MQNEQLEAENAWLKKILAEMQAQGDKKDLGKIKANKLFW
jgi:hypothetical protein